ncbi:MAG: four helix bundle protein [Deltaproteobacteria bacterium]|nr:four helix bundle protein [Deltaproteobacteria bacterium]
MEESKYHDFRDLEVWKRCRDIRKQIWALLRDFPEEEKYRLSDQMIRASRSSTACIAEGYGRYHYQENIQFCRQSRGSLYELIDHILVAEECEYIDHGVSQTRIDEIKTSIVVLNGYIRYLKKRKESD